MFGKGPPREEEGMGGGGTLGSILNGGKGKLLGMEGLNKREGESDVGGGTRMVLLMNLLKRAAFGAGVIGSYIPRGKYGGRAYGLKVFAKNAGLK